MSFLDGEERVLLTKEDILHIPNTGERTFVTACLNKHVEVVAQIPLGKSTID